MTNIDIDDTSDETDAAIEDISDSSDQGDFQLETDAQVCDAITMLSDNKEIKPENWETMDEGERLNTLQGIENQMAEIQGRESLPIIADHDLDQNVCGGYNGSEIHINSDHIAGDQPVEENVDTIIHEGRHAFQDFAVQNPGVVSDNSVVDQWAENLELGNYLSAELYGQAVYENQPIEADANSYASSIIDGLYRERK
ncbi:MAG: hypothetical protein GYA51_07625 [Candidatus Methanofastidiosa archaeon]|nr:hypothetical protein [Candidatus Methanofastidiosa archaeon]